MHSVSVPFINALKLGRSQCKNSMFAAPINVFFRAGITLHFQYVILYIAGSKWFLESGHYKGDSGSYQEFALGQTKLITIRYVELT